MNTSGNKTASRAGQAFGGTGDRIMSRVVFCVAVTGIVILIFILGFLIANGLPVLESTSLGEMFFSKDWYPTEEPPALGMVALIAGTLAATLLSSVMAIPVSIALAIFSAEIAPRKVRQCFKVLFEMLGFLPSIVLGFIGMMIIAPWMQVGLGIPERPEPSQLFDFAGIPDNPLGRLAFGRGPRRGAGRAARRFLRARRDAARDDLQGRIPERASPESSPRRCSA